ncbi:MAG TPA: serine hydrolase domain-containing protein, partial [Parachlamydiaceae bacterium]|nr:serine hydrolase domain-containing protein [Parachlamydiaceae bacterium]
MDSNCHFNITTQIKTFEFDLIANDFGYTVKTIDDDDLPIIQRLIKNALSEEPATMTVLANRLKQLPEILHVEMNSLVKTNTIVIPMLLNKETTTEIKSKSLENIAGTLLTQLKTTCPEGAGSMVMIGRPKEGAVVFSAGMRSVEGQPINNQTAALIGSGSKMFTSLCTMTLINQGAINKKTEQPLTLDTKVSDIFSKKQMLLFDDPVKANNLTLGMLLSHTSGLVYFADDNRDERQGMGLSEILDNKEAGSVKFYGHPGDGIYSYSNHIGLVAAMLEIACDTPYEEILKEQLLIPLGMSRTSYKCPSDDNVLWAYTPISDTNSSPSSTKKEVKDPM